MTLYHSSITLLRRLAPGQTVSVTVTSKSMYPTLFPGDSIFIRKDFYDTVRVGDVILFSQPNSDQAIIHRVISIQKRLKKRIFITKGDASFVRDPFIVTEKNYIGKAISIKYTLSGFLNKMKFLIFS